MAREKWIKNMSDEELIEKGVSVLKDVKKLKEKITSLKYEIQKQRNNLASKQMTLDKCSHIAKMRINEREA